MNNLLPCPFCGSQKVQFYGKQRPYWTVVCECGADVGLCHTKDQAEQSWNRRPTPEPQPDASAEGRENVEGYAASLEQMAASAYRLRGESLPEDCKGCLLEAAALLRRLSHKAGDVATWPSSCPYCTSDNQAIRETYFDQNCIGCADRMFAPSAPVAGSDAMREALIAIRDSTFRNAMQLRSIAQRALEAKP